MCLCFLFTLLPAAGAAPDNRTKTIRAAWYEDSDHITGEKGERSGYGYEYEQAVASYTGWRYDYVKGDWSELLEGVQISTSWVRFPARPTAKRPCFFPSCRWARRSVTSTPT